MDVTILRNKKTKNFPELSLYLAEIRIVILKVLMQIKSIAELGHSDVCWWVKFCSVDSNSRITTVFDKVDGLLGAQYISTVEGPSKMATVHHY